MQIGKIRMTKRGIYWTVVFAVLFGVLLFHVGLFLPRANGGSRRWLLLFAGLSLLLAVTYLRLLRVFSSGEDTGVRTISLPHFLASLIIFPTAWHLGVELIFNPKIRELDKAHHLADIAICAAVFLVLFFLFRSLRIALWTGTIFYFVFACIEYYVVSFRGVPMMFSDLMDVGAAFAVAEEYKIRATATMLAVFIVLFCLCVWFLHKGDRTPFFKGRAASLIGRIAALAGLLIIGIMIDRSAAYSNFIGSLNVSLRAFYRNGAQLAFIQSAKNAHVTPPEGYSVSEVRELADEYIEKAKAYNGALPASSGVSPDRKPNVIAIMNESFSDIDVTGADGLMARVMPNISALHEDTVKGFTLVSTYGGGTSRSEYEFNTGDSMHFFHTSSSPYALFGSRMRSALASQLKAEGYRTVAMHPYKKNNYNRPRTYAAMGFDEYLSEPDFENAERVRRYVSDKTVYDKMLSLVRESEAPFFGFTVTMQNHGPYTFEPFEANEKAGKGKNAEANQFVSLIKKSDEAFAGLIEALKEIGEPTIVVMFGDHLPGLAGSFYRNYNGFNSGSQDPEENLLYYRTPYVIWANYDIPEAEDRTTSLNYLGGTVLKLAGCRLTPYQLYLEELMEKLPAFSQKGYLGADGALHGYGDDPEVEKLTALNDRIIYNELIDRGNRVDAFYEVPEDGNG